MSDIKSAAMTTEHADPLPEIEEGQAIMATSALSSHFEHEQHALTTLRPPKPTSSP
jgi:hypothetical protein